MKAAAQREAKFMGRETGGKGNKGFLGAALAGALAAAQEELPTGSGVDNTYGQKGMDDSNLTRIQNQAYNTALTNNMAGLGGDFDFGPQSSQMAIGSALGQLAQRGALQAGQFRGRRRIRRFNRGRRRGAGDSFRRGGRRIQEFTSTQLNI